MYFDDLDCVVFRVDAHAGMSKLEAAEHPQPQSAINADTSCPSATFLFDACLSIVLRLAAWPMAAVDLQCYC
jgi:hypothetical protein